MREAERRLPPAPCCLSRDQVLDYKHFWKRFGLVANPSYACYYTKLSGIFDTGYVPNDLFYTGIERVLNNPNDTYHYANKNLFELNFEASLFPKTLLRYFSQTFYDEEYRELSAEKAFNKLRQINEPFVRKIAEESCGGHGVSFHDPRTLDSGRHSNELWGRFLNESRPFLIQEKIKQGDFTAAFNPGSVNTFRVVTLRRPVTGDAVVLKRILRMGVEGSQVDNQSSGGLSVGMFDCGRLNTIAFDGRGNGYPAHPTSKVPFAAKRFAAVKELDAFALSFSRFAPTLRLLALDIAQQQNGSFICLEVNTYGMQIDFLQTFDGGLFSEHTADVLAYCAEHAANSSFKYVRGFYF